MSHAYNPIVRTFCRFRSGLLNCMEIARQDVRPDTPLETLLPFDRRPEVWRELRRLGLRLPPLEASQAEKRKQGRRLWRVLKATVTFAVHTQQWTALLLVLPLGLAVSWWSRRTAVQFPLGLRTVGELVLYSTCPAEHKESGYRWTRNEIALKVRLIIAESMGLPLEAVQPECTFAELEAM